MKRVRIGVIGLGFGLQHVRTLANLGEAELVAVADRRSGQLEAVGTQYGVRAYRDGLEMIAQESLDAVSLCTAPHTREVLMNAAAQKGLAMLVEKPWATDLAHARRLATLCQQHPAPVMVAFSFRFHPVVVKLKEMLEGDLGVPWLLNGAYVFGWNPAPDGWLWRPDSGNGFFNENSCHLLDVVCHLLGQPLSVQAEATNPQDSPSENAAALTLRFENGAIAALTLGGVGTGAWKETGRIDLIAAGGQAKLTAREHVWEQLRWTRRGDTAIHEMTQSPEALGDTRYSHAFRHFLHCVRTGEKPTATLEDGFRSVALAMAIYQAARTGRKVEVERA